MSETLRTGPYADPPVIETYFFRQDGERFERVQMKLKSGGWHRRDFNCRTGDAHEWFWIPDADGYFVALHVLTEDLRIICDAAQESA